MSSAKKCDRCGKLYEHYSGIELMDGGNCYNWLRLFTTHGSSYKTYDLCPTCMTQVIAFLNNHKEPITKNCWTCKHGDQYPACPGCSTDSFEKWEAKNNGRST